MINSFATLKKLIIATLLFLMVHVLLFKLPFFKNVESEFYYSIPVLYLLFFIFSSLILIVVTKISEKNFDNTGMVFMIATSIKMVAAFFLVRPILHLEDHKIEKINFFAIFIVFLLFETIIVAKILNKK